MPRLILDTPSTEEKKPRLVLDEPSSIGPRLVADDSIPPATEEEMNAPVEEKRFDKMSPLMKFLDVVGRPGYAVRAALFEIQKQTPKEPSPSQVVEQGLDENAQLPPERPASAPAVVQAFWRGLHGRERKRFEDLLENEGIKLRFPGLGLAGEAATDPLMYGGYSAVMRGVGKGAQLISKIPPVAAGLKKTAEVTKPIAELFINKSRIPELTNLIDKWISERHWLKGNEMRYAAQTRLATRSIARRQKMTTKEVGQRVANIVELRYHPNELAKVVPNVTAEERVLANTLQSHLSNMIVDEMKRGVPISPLSAVRDAKVAKLRKNLDVIRVQYGKELSRTRGKLQRELELYGNQKLDEVTSKLVKEQKGWEEAAYQQHLRKSAQLNQQIDVIEKQMTSLERLKVKAAKKGEVNAVKNLDKQLDKMENQFWYLHSELADRLQDIPELASGTLFTKHIDDISKLLSSDIEVNLGPKGVSLAKQIMKTEEKIGKLPTTPIGIPIGESRKLLKRLTVERAKREFGYFPRITSDEAKEILMSMRIGRSKLWTPEMVHRLRRQTHDFTLQEFNDFVQSFGLKSLSGQTIEQFFLTDPAYAIAVRGTRSAKAVTSAGFLDDVANMFGKLKKGSPHDYIELPEHVMQIAPNLKGKVFPPDVAKEIGRVTEYYLDPRYRPDIFGDLAKHFDGLQNLWKRWQLVVFPKYHFRNAAGNLFNNYLAGVSLESYPKAAALQMYHKYRRTPYMGDLTRRRIRELGISLDDAENIINKAERLGVYERGQYAADIDTSIRQQLRAGGVTGRGMRVGRTIENNARLAHFIDRLARGKSSEEAALSVKKYLFDYGDLTAFERNVMKRIAPFYTWTRKNIPLQMEALWQQPEKMMPLAAPLRNRDPLNLLRLKYTSPNLYQRLPIELRKTVDEITYVPLEGLLPASDLAKIARPQDILWELLSPFAKEPIEQMANYDIYAGRKIEGIRHETKPLLGVEVPVRIRHLLTTVVPAARITRELDKVVTKQKNRQPLTAAEWAVASTLSSVYKSNIGELRKRAIMRLMGELKELESAARRAKQAGREDAFLEIKRTIREVVSNIKDVR